MSPKVAIVTGANKGIGFAIVRGLCKRFEGVVYLTSRDVERGKKAVVDLEKEGLKPNYHQLDVTNKKSIETFRDYLEKKYDGIDVLVNNAGFMYFPNSPEPAEVQAEQTVFINYFSLLSVCETLFPLLKNGARVINISSSLGHLSMIPSEELRKKLKDPNLSVSELSALMNQYVDAVKQGTHEADWGNSPYNVSKVAVSALSIIQQRQLNDKDVKVNSVHPGYVDTDLTAHKGPLTTDQGASAPLFLALDAPDSVKGQFVWYDKSIVSWVGEKPKEEY